MAHKLHLPPLLVLTFLTLFPTLFAASPLHIQALVSPITKHTLTSQYMMAFDSRRFVVDLTGNFLLTVRFGNSPPIPCHSAECSLAQSAAPFPQCGQLGKPHCTGNDCVVSSIDTLTHVCFSTELTSINLTIAATDGHNPTALIPLPHFLSACIPPRLLRSLPPHVSGIAGLGRSNLAIPSQLSTTLSIKQNFALCLPSTGSSPGVLFFGDGPFYLLPPPGRESASFLQYTPLVKNPKKIDNYFISLKAIAINQRQIRFDPTLLAFDSHGNGGVTFSTMIPYTTLATPIYKAFLRAFDHAMSGIPHARAVKPFKLCLNTTTLGSTRVGLPVAPIDLELENGKNWTIFGSNSMKQVSNDVACLAFVDGGERAEQAMVIGSFQIEDNFLLFDVEGSRLGFSSTLFFTQTTCANFNFTSAV